jgi:hypothetical protein
MLHTFLSHTLLVKREVLTHYEVAKSMHILLFRCFAGKKYSNYLDKWEPILSSKCAPLIPGIFVFVTMTQEPTSCPYPECDEYRTIILLWIQFSLNLSALLSSPT